MEDSSVLIFFLIVLAVLLPLIILAKVNSIHTVVSQLRDEVHALKELQKRSAVESKPVRTETKEVEEEIGKGVPLFEVMTTAIPSAETVPATIEMPGMAMSSVETFADRTTVGSMTPVPAVASLPNAAPESVQGKRWIERVLGENWLSKAGIITLVLGIAFFVRHAIDQQWIGEAGRVGIGLVTGGILIGLAFRLKPKYPVFSSILAGGGVAVFYMTITLAFREYELIAQVPAFALLAAVTAFSVLLSVWHGRRELAVFSLLGGFAAPLLVSNGGGNYIVLFSYLLLLNAGMLAVSYFKRWRVIGAMSFVLTQLFLWIWLLSTNDFSPAVAILFTSLFFLQFYALALIDYFGTGAKAASYQTALILVNNLSVFLTCSYMLRHRPDPAGGIVAVVIAGVNALLLLALLRKDGPDRGLVKVVTAVVIGFAALAVPIQLRGAALTLCWALEAVLLLWLWKKLRIGVFSVAFLCLAALTLIAYGTNLFTDYLFGDPMPIVFNRVCITGMSVAAAFAVSAVILKRARRKDPSGRFVGSISLHVIGRTTTLATIGLLFLMPYLELHFQLGSRGFQDPFRSVALATYSTLYVGALALLYRRKLSYSLPVFAMLLSAVVLYAVVYTSMVAGLRFNMICLLRSAKGLFAIHLLSLPAVAGMIVLLNRNIKRISPANFSRYCWLMTATCVLIISVETVNLTAWIFGNQDNYHELVGDVRTFGFPILWGIFAMILMIWGLSRKEVELRKTALLFFGLIILKFYAYDVWHMSQAGRIVSFVLLGIILLLVSFLQQNIVSLVKGGEEPEKYRDSDEMSELSS